MRRPSQLLRVPAPGHDEPAMRELVVTGCGRVYSFPAWLPQKTRAAGFYHFAHRFGYVEPVFDRWQPRDLGNRALGMPQGSRIAAIRTVILHAGFGAEAATFPNGTSVRTGVHVRLATTPGAPSAEVYLSMDSRLYIMVGHTSALPGTQGALRLLGSIWPTRLRFASLAPSAESHRFDLHRARNAAITHLIEDAGYERVLSPHAVNVG